MAKRDEKGVRGRNAESGREREREKKKGRRKVAREASVSIVSEELISAPRHEAVPEIDAANFLTNSHGIFSLSRRGFNHRGEEGGAVSLIFTFTRLGN